ncbi:MAG: DUF2723 domain-containing protein [Pseudomonadota bacterium]
MPLPGPPGCLSVAPAQRSGSRGSSSRLSASISGSSRRGIFWLDSSEFVACARGASIPHPPGTPGYMVLAHLATLLPLGSVAFRVNLLSALLGAGAAAALFVAGRLLLARISHQTSLRSRRDPAVSGCSDQSSRSRCRSIVEDCGGRNGPRLQEDRRLQQMGGEKCGLVRIQRPGLLGDGAVALLVLSLSLSRAAWFQGIRAEVYTLNFLVTALAVALALRWDESPDTRGGHVLLVALLLGFGLTNHHYLVLLTLPAFAVFLLTRPEGRVWLAPRRLLPLLGIAAAGLLVYGLLPLRSAAGMDLSWGDATTPGGFLGMVSARAFHLSVTEMPRAPFLEACTTILESWVDLLGPTLFFAGILGLVAWVWRSPRVGGFLVLLMAAGLVSKAIMYLDVENPDDHGYFFPGLQAMTLAATGLVPVFEALRRRVLSPRWAWGATALLLVTGAGALTSNARTFDRERRTLGLSDFHAPDAIQHTFLEELPPDTVFMPSYYALFFNHVYHRAVEQRRPDVALLHQSFFRRIEDGAPYAALIRRRHPDLAAVVDEHHATGFFPWASLLELSDRRPVILEVDVLELDADDPARPAVSLGHGGLDLPWDHTRFEGPGIRLSSRAVPHRSGLSVSRTARFWQRFYRSLAGDRVHGELKKILLWIHYRDGLYFARSGQWDEAGLEAGLALRLAPDQARLVALKDLAEQRRKQPPVEILHTP